MTIAALQAKISEKIPPGLVVAEHTATAHYYRHVPTNQLFGSVTTKSGILESPHLKKWAAQMAIDLIDKNWHNITPENKQEYYDAAILAHQNNFEDAGSVGTQGHGIVDSYLKEWIATGKRPDDIRRFIVGDDIRLYAIARSAELFCKDFGARPVASELLVASLKHKFAGTLDSLMVLEKVLEKGDLSCEHEMWAVGKKDKEECFKCGRTVELVFTLVDWKTSNSIDKASYAMQVSAYWQALYELTGLKPKEILIVRLDKHHAKYEVRRVAERPFAFRAFVHATKIYDWLNSGVSKLPPYAGKEYIQLTPLADRGFVPVE